MNVSFNPNEPILWQKPTLHGQPQSRPATFLEYSNKSGKRCRIKLPDGDVREVDTKYVEKVPTTFQCQKCSHVVLVSDYHPHLKPDIALLVCSQEGCNGDMVPE